MVITPAKIVLTRVTPDRTPWGSTVRITGRVVVENGWSLEPRAWLIRPVLAKVNAKVFRLVLLGPPAAIHKVGLGPRFAIDGARRHHRHRHRALRRVSAAGP